MVNHKVTKGTKFVLHLCVLCAFVVKLFNPQMLPGYGLTRPAGVRPFANCGSTGWTKLRMWNRHNTTAPTQPVSVPGCHVFMIPQGSMQYAKPSPAGSVKICREATAARHFDGLKKFELSF